MDRVYGERVQGHICSSPHGQSLASYLGTVGPGDGGEGLGRGSVGLGEGAGNWFVSIPLEIERKSVDKTINSIISRFMTSPPPDG